MKVIETPSKDKDFTPRGAFEEMPHLSPESQGSSKSNDEKKIIAEKKGSVGGMGKTSGEEKTSRKLPRQTSIFESIGFIAPAGVRKSSTDAPNEKKRRRSVAMMPEYNIKPIRVHIITAVGEEPKKVEIYCHGIKNDYDEIFESHLVLNEKRAVLKDPLSRFLTGFGRYIH
jgi:hypothetical protein